jgi:glycosyltransferase involved in cell wall biosynthesis
MRYKAWMKFALTLRQAQPDVILPYAMRANVVCGQIWRLTGARLCIWNQRDEGRSANVGRRFQRWAARQIPSFISNSPHGKAFLIQTLGVKPDNIQIINNGVVLAKPEADRTTWRTRLGVSEDCFLACMVARLHRMKDHATLLRAWRQVIDRLAETGYPAVLLLAGRFADTYESLQLLAHELNLG